MSHEPAEGTDAVELDLEVDLPPEAVRAHLAHRGRALAAHRRLQSDLSDAHLHVHTDAHAVHVRVDGLATTTFHVLPRCDGLTRVRVRHAQPWPRLPLLAGWLAPLVSTS